MTVANPVSQVMSAIAADPNVSDDFKSAVAPVAAGDILAELRGVIDAREELSREDAKLAARKQDLERQLLAFHESSGVDALSGAGLSVSFDDEAMRAKYDPEKYAAIFVWAAETKNTHIIQRRFTDKAVLDLVQEGVALPEGLTLERYTKLNVRRK